MRFAIIGVGQMLNFENGEMEDTLQVETPQGILSIPTTNEAAQALVRLALNGGQQTPQELGQEMQQTYDRAGEMMQRPQQPVVTQDDFPEGASVFGEELEVDAEIAEARYQQEQQMFEQTEETDQAEVARQIAMKNLGRRSNPADRSGVPSTGIARVDEKGNPILPPPPDEDDDEEDPGEQV